MSEVEPASAKAEWRSSWPLVLTAFLGMSMAALSTSSMGVMLIPMQEATGWSRAQISSGPLLIFAVGLFTATAAGFVVDRIGPRLVALVASALMCGAVALMGQIGPHLWHWLALWGLVGLASAAFPSVWIQPVTHRFVAGRGFAMAIVLCGSGLSPFAVAWIANLMLEDYGWRMTYLTIGGIWAAAVLPLTLLFVRSPEKRAASEGDDANPPPDDLPGLTVPQGFRGAAFWKIFLGYVTLNFGALALLLNLPPVLVSTGLSLTTATWIYGFSGFATIGGRVVGGWLVDRLPARAMAAISCIGMGMLPLLLLLFPGSVAGAFAALLIFSVMGGALSPAIAYLVSKHIGPKSFATFYQTVNMGASITIGLAPLAANFIFDQVHSYRPVMIAAIPLAIVAALLFASTGRYPVFGEAARRDAPAG
ncbi:MAG: MFS transporter [Novosphingobium sp.]